ncbi:DNA-processing protein DprA [Roseibium aggregatum]|uniref:DNA-protecting protein DprA n=1 Tax=Roseibium aggregatum TaxID=187304 RepID=A0A939EBH9_9HYPH|nr:DNA-processing protein DprA [Roseibium aggregatum]MBN9670115.1 DNA-protecting protein DprA [Roseibium aggregatum]
MTGLDEDKTVRLSEAERLAWLRLIRSENIGPATFRDLLSHAGSAEDALELLPELSRRGGRKSYQLCSEDDAQAEMEAHRKHGARLVALGEADYPPHLRHIDGPPPLLSVKGGDTLARPKMLAVVGARNASLSGRKLSGMFARDLGAHGFAIASGLARGIDAAAHEAALSTGTVAVFAGGIDRLYPPEHARLLDAILETGGSAISEMPLGWKPRGRDFPRRNRLISGTSLGVIVIEAAKASGSLHTARFALEQNRDIFAVPGSPLDPRSEGANGLIRQGAALVTSAEDILESLAGRLEPELPLGTGLLEPDRARPSGQRSPNEAVRDRVITALGPAPLDLDELIRYADAEARTVHVILLELELAGRLERHRGNKISLLM